MLPENHKHSDSIALTEGLLIAARRLSGDGLALSVIASQCHLSHRERLSPAGRQNVFVRVPFRRKVCYTGLAALPADFNRRGVSFMVHFLAILESVVADVISHYICKWLDRFDKDRKPD